MANTRINNANAIAACNGIVDSADDGPAAGVIEIRTGAAPTNCADADTGTLLASLTFGDPAFGNAVDQNPGGRATAATITGDASADATGAAGHFRIKNSTGVVKWQGDVTGTGGGGDMELDNVNIQAGVQVDITSFTFDVPEA